jgi:hypothetical protein
MKRLSRKWLVVKWSLWKYAVPAVFNVVLSLICYTIGWHLSTSDSAMPLARAGAAATAIAIAFTLYDYRKALQASGQRASKTFERSTRLLPNTGKTSQQKLEDKIQRKTAHADLIITLMQAILLILATLVWGFGDLANRWIIGQ